MMASSRWPAAEALTYGSSSTLAAVKSVHFGQQQQQTALQQAARGQQKMEEAERAAPAAGETKRAGRSHNRPGDCGQFGIDFCPGCPSRKNGGKIRDRPESTIPLLDDRPSGCRQLPDCCTSICGKEREREREREREKKWSWKMGGQSPSLGAPFAAEGAVGVQQHAGHSHGKW